jgi:hypothetical protein
MNFSALSNLSAWHYRRAMAISLSTVVLVDLLGTSIGFSSAVSAKPRPSAPVVTSQLTNKATANGRSPQPVDAVLANVQSKPSTRSKISGAPRQVVKSSQAPTRQVTTDRTFQGISHLIDTDRQTDVSPVDRLIK